MSQEVLEFILSAVEAVRIHQSYLLRLEFLMINRCSRSSINTLDYVERVIAFQLLSLCGEQWNLALEEVIPLIAGPWN